MSLRFEQKMAEKEAFAMNALQLAYLGDCVWDTVVRYRLVLKKLNVRHLHTECVRHVNAGAQAGYLESMISRLNERELDIVRRGRNAHPKHPVPHNQQPEDYAASTGFEALIGYLYLTGQDERIAELLQGIFEEEETACQPPQNSK